MAGQHHVEVIDFRQDRRESVPDRDAAGLRVRSDAVERAVEGEDRPGGLVALLCDRLLDELPVRLEVAVLRGDVEVEHVVLLEPVVAPGGVLLPLVGQAEVLVEQRLRLRAVVVVVAQRLRGRLRAHLLRSDVRGVLRGVTRVVVDLVAGRQEEVGVREHLVRAVERGLPASRVALEVAGRAQLRVADERELVLQVRVVVLELLDLRPAALLAAHTVGVGGAGLEAGDGCVDVVVGAVGGGAAVHRLDGLRVRGHRLVCSGCDLHGLVHTGIREPGDAALALVGAHAQEDGRLPLGLRCLLEGQVLEVEVQVRAGRATLVQLDGDRVLALDQDLRVHGEGALARCRAVRPAVLHVASLAGLRVLDVVVVEARDLLAVDEDRRGVVVADGAGQLLAVGQLLRIDGHVRAEEERLGVGAGLVLLVLSQEVVRQEPAVELLALTAESAEGAGRRLPLRIVEGGSGPIGPVFQPVGRIRIRVEVGPRRLAALQERDRIDGVGGGGHGGRGDCGTQQRQCGTRGEEPGEAGHGKPFMRSEQRARGYGLTTY